MDWRSGAVKGWIRSYKVLTNLGVFAVAGTIRPESDVGTALIPA
jgi:hypothetical protein